MIPSQNPNNPTKPQPQPTPQAEPQLKPQPTPQAPDIHSVQFLIRNQLDKNFLKISQTLASPYAYVKPQPLSHGQVMLIQPDKQLLVEFWTQAPIYSEEGAGIKFQFKSEGFNYLCYFYGKLSGHVGLSFGSYDEARNNATDDKCDLYLGMGWRVKVVYSQGSGVVIFQEA